MRGWAKEQTRLRSALSDPFRVAGQCSSNHAEVSVRVTSSGSFTLHRLRVRLCDDWLDIFISFEVLERLTRIAPRFGNMPFVFLSALTDRNSQLKGRQLGADDYVTKPIDLDVLGTIIAARLAHVARTDVWVRDVQLNDREVETLARVAHGKTSAEVAQILELSKRTVDFHIDNARNKLGVSTRTEDAVKALTGRLIEP